jgi:outer membrane lipoprotein-sorting protein
MLQKSLINGVMLGLMVVGVAAETTPKQTTPSAAEIVRKNVAARGGLQAWRNVRALSFTGKIAAGGDQRGTRPVPLPVKQAGKLPPSHRLQQEAQLPFVLKMQRPRKVRLELEFKGQTSLQVYDGTNGWMFRPYMNRTDVESFSPDELKKASMQPDIDGPLVDYIAKGTQIEFVGMEKLGDRDTYNLKLSMKNGQTTHVWIDAQTFLEAKIEGQPRRLDGKIRSVEIYYSDYRPVSGLLIPFVLETKVLPLAESTRQSGESAVPAEKITIEEVSVNPAFDPTQFSKPEIKTASTRPPQDKQGIGQ